MLPCRASKPYDIYQECAMTTLNEQKKSLIFEHLTPEQNEKLLSHRVKRQLKAGQTLFDEGQPADYFYQLENGMISLFRFSPEGEEKLFQQLVSGEMLAESAVLMEPAVYPVNAKVVQDTIVWCYPRSTLKTLCKENSEFAMQLLSALANRLHQAVNRIDQLTLKNAGQRLAAYLIEQKKIQQGDWLTLPVNHAQLARQLNIAPETLSRLFKKLKQAEVISINKQTVVLIDISSMCEIVSLPYFESASEQAKQPAQSCVTGCCNIFTRWF